MLRLWNCRQFLAGLILAGPSFAADTPAKPVDMEWGVKIPLRDGVRLNATLYRPHEQKEALPVIFTLTPYIGDSYLDRATYFSQNGYVYALVDVRGRGNSEGRFEPFANEGRDVGRVLRGLRSMVDTEGVPAASDYDRSGRCRTPGRGLPILP